MYNSEEAIIREAQKGDNQAVNLLIQRNMDIVYAKARYFFIKGLDREDVIQEGLVGLYKAIRDYPKTGQPPFGVLLSFASTGNLCQPLKGLIGRNIFL